MRKINLSKIRNFLSRFKWLNSESSLEKKNWYTLWILILTITWLFIWYLQLWKVSDISKNISAYNPQKIKTSNLTATELVQLYYKLLGEQDYESTCGIETLWQCRYENKDEFLKYQENKKRYWFTKLVNGESLLRTWQYDWAKIWSIEYVCLRTQYEYSWENTPIQELWEYKILTRGTWEKEIAYKQCVWKWKDWKMTDWKSCPVLNDKCANSEPK